MRFVDKDSHYEIWQGREGRRPLVVTEDGRLRFVEGAEPSPFNIRD
ncbi:MULTISPECIES: hypothetical protein [unclassified Streptomyces]